MPRNYIIHNGMLISSDELMHWKYIKKVKKNGKWVYYYDDSEVKKAEDNLKKAESDRVAANLKVYNTENDLKDIRKNSDKYREKNYVNTDEYYKKINKLQDVYGERVTKLNKAEKKLDKAMKKYDNVRVKHLAVSVIAKGAAFIANLFSGSLFSKKKKSKKK